MLPSSKGVGGGNHLGGSPQLLALGLPLVPNTHGSPSRSRSHPGRDSAPVFRAPHILLMTYGLSGGSRQEVGWTLLQETWILVEKPSFIQSKEEKKKPAAMPAGRLCSAINRRCLFYTNLLHRTTKLRRRFPGCRLSPPLLPMLMPAGFALVPLFCFDMWNYCLIKSSKRGC